MYWVKKRTGGMQMYIDNIQPLVQAAKAEMLDVETERRLAQAWREHQDVEARNRLVEAHMRLAVKMTRKFLHYGVPRSDLIQEANLALLRATEKFDPDRGHRFSTYAMLWIKTALQEYVMRNWSLVRVGLTASKKSLFFRLRAVQTKLENEALARGESIDAYQLQELIAAEFDVPVSNVELMQKYLSGPDYSLNAPRSIDEEGELEWIDLLVDESRPAAKTVADHRDTLQLREWLVVGLHSLKPRESHILLRRTLSDCMLKNLGDEYNVSPERVRQIENDSLKKMRKNLQTQSPEAQQLLFT